MEKKNRIILFWILTILGFLAHSLADALPAFWEIASWPRKALLHMSELIEGFNPVQLLIMPMMFVIALLMAVDSVKICKS